MEPAQADGNMLDDYYDEDLFSPLPFNPNEYLICRQCQVLQPMVSYYKTRFIREFVPEPHLDASRTFCFNCRCENILDKMTPTNPDITARMEQCRIYLRAKRAEEAREAAWKQERKQLEPERKRQKKTNQVLESRFKGANKVVPETGKPTGLENLVVEPSEPLYPESGYEGSGEATDGTGSGEATDDTGGE